MHEIMGDVTPNKDQLSVVQESWKRKNSPGEPKNFTGVYNWSQKPILMFPVAY